MASTSRIRLILASAALGNSLLPAVVTAQDVSVQAGPVAISEIPRNVASSSSIAQSDAGNAATPVSLDTLPEAPGKREVMQSCLGGCHQIEIFERDYTAREWQQRVDEMIGLGAPVTEENYYAIVLYLTENVATREDNP